MVDFGQRRFRAWQADVRTAAGLLERGWIDQRLFELLTVPMRSAELQRLWWRTMWTAQRRRADEAYRELRAQRTPDPLPPR